ncbi:MAG: hypothetical protein DI616_01235 [Paracoccus denitrificans]|uniref:SRPBCC family protein n=1 Tax=Paracoccus denitrificans TaxID=266 RepID=A0A533IDT6_PARDE|nr:MAG: hypothetical protein DI616_01235 [Paracoccus denitrificans]
MQTIILQHDYPVTAAALWAAALDYAGLDQLIGGASGDRAPSSPEKGRVIGIHISLFGTSRAHFIRVVECDHVRMILRARETGRGRLRWRHTMAVTPAGQGSRLTDRIEIEAGILNPAFSLWARRHFRARHLARLRLLDDPARRT